MENIEKVFVLKSTLSTIREPTKGFIEFVGEALECINTLRKALYVL